MSREDIAVLDPRVLFPNEPEIVTHGEMGTTSMKMSVETALDKLADIESRYETFEVHSPRLLNLELRPDDNAKQNILGIKGDIIVRHDALKGSAYEEIVLSEMAMRTAVSMMGLTPGWFKKNLPEASRFSRFRGLMGETFSRSHENGFNIRLYSDTFDTPTVDAFLPGDWNGVSDFGILEDMIKAVQSRYGSDAVAGIEGIFGDQRGNVGLRMVINDPIIDEGISSIHSAMPMISFSSNMYGLFPTTADLGVWQVICWNGMITRIEGISASWQHRGDIGKFDAFRRRLETMISSIGHYIPIQREMIRNVAHKELALPWSQIVNRLADIRAIDNIHCEAMLHMGQFTTQETEWDLISLATDAAKTVNPLTKRAKAEQNASTIAHWPGGLNALLGEKFVTETQRAFLEGSDKGSPYASLIKEFAENDDEDVLDSDLT